MKTLVQKQQSVLVKQLSDSNIELPGQGSQPLEIEKLKQKEWVSDQFWPNEFWLRKSEVSPEQPRNPRYICEVTPRVKVVATPFGNWCHVCPTVSIWCAVSAKAVEDMPEQIKTHRVLDTILYLDLFASLKCIGKASKSSCRSALLTWKIILMSGEQGELS